MSFNCGGNISLTLKTVDTENSPEEKTRCQTNLIQVMSVRKRFIMSASANGEDESSRLALTVIGCPSGLGIGSV